MVRKVMATERESSEVILRVNGECTHGLARTALRWPRAGHVPMRVM
jgi:hypothetical protein